MPERIEDTRAYQAVVHDGEHYSVWLADREVPKGWRAVGRTGLKDECLSSIGQVWTDMRPLSLRKKLAQGSA